MFVKLAGAGIVVLSSFLIGWHASLSWEFRKEDLTSIRNLLTRFMSQLSYGNALLHEAALNVCDETCASEVFRLFGEELKNRSKDSVFDMWQTSVKKGTQSLYINSADRRELTEVGKIFSYSDPAIQTKAINSTINYADGEIKKLAEDEGKSVKIYRSLGAAIGLFVVIVLF